MPDLKLQQVADRLDVHINTVRGWVASGVLPAHRLGPRAIRVRSEDLAHVTRPIAGVSAVDFAEQIERLVAQAPPLSDEQRRRLTTLLRPVDA